MEKLLKAHLKRLVIKEMIIICHIDEKRKKHDNDFSLFYLDDQNIINCGFSPPCLASNHREKGFHFFLLK